MDFKWKIKELEIIGASNKIHSNPTYAIFKPKINKLLIWPGAPLNTENVMFSFDDGGFFEIPKPNDFDGSYSIFQIDFKMGSPYINLKYKLSNQKEIGPYKYKIDGITELIQESYKNNSNKELENMFKCYKIPAYQEKPDKNTRSEDYDTYNKKYVEALESQQISMQLEQFGYIIPKDDKAKIVCLDKTNMRMKTKHKNINYLNKNLLSVKEIRFGNNTNNLNKKIPIDLDIQRVIETDKPQNLYDHKLTETLMVEFSSEVKTIYAQLTYFDDTKSRIVRLTINEEFNTRNY